MILSKKIVFAFSVPVVFPEGFSVGSSGKDNFIGIERDGNGNPVLRGTSIAGVLRSLAEQEFEDITPFFGAALDRGMDRLESPTVFFDAVFQDKTDVSMHNLVNRHLGAVAVSEKGLFSMERVAPGAKCRIQFYFQCEKIDLDYGKEYVDFLIKKLQSGLFFGGNQARGIGRAIVDGAEFAVQQFDTDNKQDLAAFLDLLYSDTPWNLKDCVRVTETESDSMKIQITFGIPRGQDLLCAEGTDSVPVTTSCWDGVERWKIPGSTLRGIFKAWISRLAARDGAVLADSVQQHLEVSGKTMVDIQNKAAAENDPVLDIFGSLKKKGRLHISDAYSNLPFDPAKNQFRVHVAIDSFSGGTNPGRLFRNYVLTDPSGELEFKTILTLHSPKEKECEWLEKTLQAIQIGLLRFGSSKASGRLTIKAVDVLNLPAETKFNFNVKGK